MKKVIVVALVLLISKILNMLNKQLINQEKKLMEDKFMLTFLNQEIKEIEVPIKIKDHLITRETRDTREIREAQILKKIKHSKEK